MGRETQALEEAIRNLAAARLENPPRSWDYGTIVRVQEHGERRAERLRMKSAANVGKPLRRLDRRRGTQKSRVD